MATTKASLIEGQYVQVTGGGKPILLQSLGDEVRIVFNDAQPAAGNTVFHVLADRDRLFFEFNDSAIWAMPLTCRAALIATEGSDRCCSGTSVEYQLATGDQAIQAGEHWIVKTTTSDVTLLFPPTANFGDEIHILDATENQYTNGSGVNNQLITIDANGLNIEEMLTFTTTLQGSAMRWVYTGDVVGWKLFDN